MGFRELINKLFQTRTSVHHLKTVSRPGVYAVYINDRQALKLAIDPNGLIYVGGTSSLADRTIRGHFESGSTGFSTLRRSLGALLKVELDLRAIPRGRSAVESNVRNYRFTDAGEERLTKWMTTHLDVGTCMVEEPNRRTTEKAIIRELEPPLCLQGWPNPERRRMMSLRRVCADEARGTATDGQ